MSEARVEDEHAQTESSVALAEEERVAAALRPRLTDAWLETLVHVIRALDRAPLDAPEVFAVAEWCFEVREKEVPDELYERFADLEREILSSPVDAALVRFIARLDDLELDALESCDGACLTTLDDLDVASLPYLLHFGLARSTVEGDDLYLEITPVGFQALTDRGRRPPP